MPPAARQGSAAPAKGAAAKPTAQKKSAPKRKPGSAVRAAAGQEPEARTVEFRGLTITLPDRLPSSMLFHMVDLESDGNILAAFKLLRETIGADQFAEVSRLMRPDEDPIMGAFTMVNELIGVVFAEMGVDAGEAEASQSS